MTQTLSRILFALLVSLAIIGCEDEEPAPSCDGSLAVAVASTVDPSCGDNNGSITVSSSGANGAVTYQLDGGTAQAMTTFGDLNQGTYTVKVTDENSCTAEVEAKLATGLLIADIKPIITTSCAISNCHNGDRAQIPNYSIDANIVTDAAKIKTRTGNESMPPAGQPDLTTEQIQSIACWVDDGAPTE